MSKWLVNLPDGTQEIQDFGSGGQYHGDDPNYIVWREAQDGGFPANFKQSDLGGYKRVDNQLVFDQSLKDTHTALLATQATALAQEESDRTDRLTAFKAIDSISNIADLKTFLKKLVKHMRLD